MSTILFIFYLLFFSWLLIRIPFVKRSGLGAGFILSIFILKVLAGVAYGYVHAHAPGHVGLTDTWKFFYQGAEQTALLKKDPSVFFRDLWPQKAHSGFGRLFSTSHSFWNDIKHELMVKFASVLNLFSGTNYYVNTVWYNFIVFFGPLSLYRAISPFMTRQVVVRATAFLLPSALFWGSGFHKEGLTFAALSFIFYVLSRAYRGEKNNLRHLGGVLLSVLLLMLLRNNLLLPLIPAWLGYLAAGRSSSRPGIAYLAVLCICVAAFFLSPLLGVDLPASVSQRQHEFAKLGGRTAVAVPELRAGVRGFIHNFPSAVDIGFFRPRPFEGGLSYLPFTFELFLLLALCLYVLADKHKGTMAIRPALFLVTLSLLALLMIGYTVPNIGAVVRYRSVVLPFLFSGLAMLASWRFVKYK